MGRKRILVPSARRLRYLVPIIAVVVLLAGGGFAAFETDTVDSYWQGVWWALSLITTVGFVAAPETTAGRILSAVLIILGFLLLASVTATIASLFVREAEMPEEAREHAFEERVLDELRELREQLQRLERSRPPPGE